MNDIKKLMEELEKLVSKRDELINRLISSIPYSEVGKQEIDNLNREIKRLENELRTTLYKKYDELSDVSGHIPGYSRTDFENDMKISNNKVIEELSKYC